MLFRHPRTHMGGGGLPPPPRAISPLIEIELRDKDQSIFWDVFSIIVPELTALGHMLTLPGQVKLKKIAFSSRAVFRE